MTVREAEARDLAALRALYSEFNRHNAAMQPAYYRPADEDGRYPQGVIDSRSAALFVAECGGGMAGFIHVRSMKTPPYKVFIPMEYAEVVDLLVAPGYRRRGIASRLLEAAEQWAASRGMAYMELMVLKENDAAIRVYEKQGYNAASHIMRKPLKP